MKISFLSVTIAVSIGLGLGYGAYQAKNRIPDFLDRPRFAVVNLNSVVKANEVRVVSQGKHGEEIIGEAEHFAKRLKEELAQIENECDCVLLVSSAVISNAKLPDSPYRQTRPFCRAAKQSASADRSSIKQRSQSMSRMKAHPRVFWHRLKDHVRRFGWIWLAVFLILSLVNHRWHLALNRSHSLPFKLFAIERGQKEVKVGDYVAFEPKPSAVGGYRLTFIKEVGCGPGQTLTRENRTFYCDGKELTTAKERALNGNPLVATQPQVLGEDQYFVRGTHKDSYDSRYEAFGLIARCRFSGKAHPLF